MTPLRVFILLACVCGTMSLPLCEVSSKQTLADLIATRRKLTALMMSLRGHVADVGVSVPGEVSGPEAVPIHEYVHYLECDAISNQTLADIIAIKGRLILLIKLLQDYATKSGAMESLGSTSSRPAPTDELAVPPTAPDDLSNCKQIFNAGFTTSGIYQIAVFGFNQSVPVVCDMTTDGGGWAVFQRRLDGSVHFFNRTFAEYATGFGTLDGEFWMGNELISAITNTTLMELRVDMTDWEGEGVYATYSRFVVDGSAKKYRLTLGEYEGTAGDSLGYQNRSLFSAHDVDNDNANTRNCALNHNGGWWFKNCMRCNLNGYYHQDGAQETYANGVVWSRFRGLKYSLRATEMKMRPVL